MRLNVDNVHTRESGLFPDEIMISESQERMLIITEQAKTTKAKRKFVINFELMCSTNWIC